MADSLTYEKVLELIKETHRLSSERMEKESHKSLLEFEKRLEQGFEKRRKEREEEYLQRKKEREEEYLQRKKEREEERHQRRKEFEAKLLKNRNEFEAELLKSRNEFEEELRKDRKEFNKKLGEITGTLGRFVEGMIKPRLIEMFREQGIYVTTIFNNVELHDDKGQKITEIDILLVNSVYSIAVEVKTTLNVEAVDEHIDRLHTLQKNPRTFIKGHILLGAVAGMVIQQDADRYAYKKGLYVLKQKGEIVEIANNPEFKPREWIVP